MKMSNQISDENRLKQRIKICVGMMIIGLALSGVTAFPIETELKWLVNHSAGFPNQMGAWLRIIYKAVVITNQQYPYLSYGTDWLAFAHLVLALLFIGPLIDPVKNVWVIQFGIIACVLIVPLAFIAGGIRHIPVFWRLIDCSFGLFGIIPLIVCHRSISRLSRSKSLCI